jgi:diguanylate cyclase (GGDEF)-like protein
MDFWYVKGYPEGRPTLRQNPALPMRMNQSADPRIAQLTARRRPAVAFAIGVLACALLLLIGAQAWHAWAARHLRLSQAAVDTSNMSRALAAQGESSVRIVDTVLASVVDRIENDGIGRGATARLETYLRSTVQTVPELHGLFIYGHDGRWLATSLPKPLRANNSDRDYFRYHATHTDRGPHVGVPIRSRSTGIWILPVSRRLENPDGSFAGVALGTIRVDFFARLYDSFDVGRSGTIFLALDNGTLVYRRPFNETLPGTSIKEGPVYQMYKATGPVGTALLTSRIDQVDRLYSYRRMNSFPLIVATAQSKDEILGEWLQATILLVVGSVVAVGFLGWLGRRMVRQIVIRDKLEQQLVIAKESLQTQNSALTVLAKNDGLTGIANRRHFEEFLAFELSRASRNASTLSLIIMDVDFFKKFNDRYGHVAGDDCLRKVAAVLEQALVRPTDLAARYGGEEFVVILPDTDRVGAVYVAEKIRSAVLGLRISHADSPANVVSVSGGVCSVSVARGEVVDGKALIERADALLYAAKLAGRNQFVGEDELIAEAKSM